MVEPGLGIDAGLSVDRLLGLNRLTAAVPSPCGTWMAVAVSRLDADRGAYVSDLWRVSLVAPAHESPPIQLTRGASADHAPKFRADGALGFLSNRALSGDGAIDADGRSQVWVLDPRGGEPAPITDEPLGVREYRFGGERVFVAALVVRGVPLANQREYARTRSTRGPSGLRYSAMPTRHWDRWLPQDALHIAVWDRPLDPAARRDLTPGADREHREDDAGLDWDVSPCGRWVAVSARRTSPNRFEDSALRLIDADSGDWRDVGEVTGATHELPRFSPDSRRVACVRATHGPGSASRPALWMFDVGGGDGGAGRALAADWDRWPEVHGWTPDGHAVVVTAHDHGAAPVFSVDATTGEHTRITSERAGGSHMSITAAVIDGAAHIVGLRHRFTHPPEPFRAALRPRAEPELVAALSGFDAAAGEAIARHESFSVAADDGVQVQSFLITPAGGQGPHPALVWIHGGPSSHHADGWHWRWNPLVAAAHGYAVVLPNPRGSTGFGQDFIQGVWGNTWGAACYRDIMAVVEVAAARPDIDADRMAAMGGSFGGYMTNWIGTRTTRFRCLLTHAGVFSLPTFHDTTDYPAYFAMMMSPTTPDGVAVTDDMATAASADAGGRDSGDHLDRYSPHRGVARWPTPTLITHGALDYRVPVSEALAQFEALTRRGVDVELLIYPDENHWIRRPENSRQWYEAMLAFADRHLRRELP